MLRQLLLAGALSAALSSPVWAAPDWAAVDRTIGRPGAEQAGGVHRYAFPRSDLKVTLDRVAIKPALALGSWAAFMPMGDQVMVMGDLVLTHDEVNPVMSKLIAGGFEITALHNHLLRSAPATMYMHIDAHGDAVKLAGILKDALSLSHTPLGAPAPATPVPLELDAAGLDAIMHAKGKPNGGVLQYNIPRKDVLMDGNIALPVSMGTSIAINFQPTGNGKAAITGDFVLIASEVNPVIRALRQNGIEVTALHNHMLDDQPRLFFMHFWANDDAQKLARGLAAALGNVAVASGG
jgi:hypothetical protein